MARVATNVLMNGLRGRIGDSLVLKTMRGKTFVSTVARMPDKKKESVAQRNTRVSFRQATEWAQMILLDAGQKAYYQQRAKKFKLPNAYTAAITDYMRKPKVMKSQHRDKVIYTVSKPGFVLKQVRVTADETMKEMSKIIAREYKDRWFIQYTESFGIVPPLILTITESSGRATVIRV